MENIGSTNVWRALLGLGEKADHTGGRRMCPMEHSRHWCGAMVYDC